LGEMGEVRGYLQLRAPPSGHAYKQHTIQNPKEFSERKYSDVCKANTVSIFLFLFNFSHLRTEQNSFSLFPCQNKAEA